MKIRYCVSLLLLCAATIFSKSTTVKAEDKYYKFLEKYFTIEEKYKSKWGQQDGFTYLCEKKDNTVTIVGIPMDKKISVILSSRDLLCTGATEICCDSWETC